MCLASQLPKGLSSILNRWPLYRQFDQSGRVVNTNDQKSNLIHFYDLTGQETATLSSAITDLSKITIADYPSLLTQPYGVIEKTELVRDVSGRVICQILPDYTKISDKTARGYDLVLVTLNSGEPLNKKIIQKLIAKNPPWTDKLLLIRRKKSVAIYGRCPPNKWLLRRGFDYQLFANLPWPDGSDKSRAQLHRVKSRKESIAKFRSEHKETKKSDELKVEFHQLTQIETRLEEAIAKTPSRLLRGEELSRNLLKTLTKIKAHLPKSGFSTRAREFELDVFGNQIAATDTLGYTTQRLFNDLNQETQKVDPRVEITEADGRIVPDFQGITVTHRNVDGIVIGTTKPASNTEGFVLDEQNKRIGWYLGDGTSYLRFVRDGFSRSVKLIDSRNFNTQRVWDMAGNLVKQIVPNNDIENDLARPLMTTYGYDEKNQRVLQQDPAGNQTYWAHDINGNIALTVNPKKDQIVYLWDRNHQKLQEILASGATQKWQPNSILGYFSVMDSYHDFGGAVYNFEYDYKLQMTSRRSSGGVRGQTAILQSYYDSSAQISKYWLDLSNPVPDQNLKMIYDVGRLIEVRDLAQDYTTITDYDSEDLPIIKQIYPGKQARWSMRTVSSRRNALKLETNFFDTMLQGVTSYDRNGNRRRRFAQVLQNSVVLQSDDNWYDYDLADRPVLVDCGLSNGKMVLSKPSSMLIHYQEGVRWEEVTQSGIRTINFYANGDISQIVDTDGATTFYHYDPAGYRKASTTNHPDGSFRDDNILCNTNLFQIYQASVDKDGYDDTELSPDKNNCIKHQNTFHTTNDGEMTVSYQLDFYNVIFEDQYLLNLVNGETSDDYGEKYTQALMLYDANGTMIGKVGADNDDKNTDGKLSVYFVTTYDGIIFEKIQFPTDTNKDLDNVFDYYFYDIHNNYLSSYEVTESPKGILKVGQNGSSGIRSRYDGVKNTGIFGHFDLDIQPRTPGMQGRFNHQMQVVQEVRPWARKMHSVDDDGSHDEAEFVQSINHLKILTTPDKYTVKPGDTFQSIAQCQYGDVNFALMIAIKNGYTSENSQPSVCSVLTLPQYVPMSNNGQNYLSFDKFSGCDFWSFISAIVVCPTATSS